jgi:AraC family transcriptional regulator of adaptative response/methylated-DNA-[protein]-cysteine methyltransferase
MINQEQCWKAVEGHDGSFDGEFVFGVMTTGVYCRPSCPSRRPLRKNVRFYATTAAAERDGLRPCKRCRPLDPERDRAAAKVRELCRHMEAHPDEAPDLAELAARAGLSRFHLQRTFKRVAGVTPKEYLEACRMRRLKRGLRDARDVTEAVYDAGFGSSSRVYERADTRLGMTPMQYRRGGQGVAITYASAATPVGLVMIGATDRGICFVQFGDSEEGLAGALRKEYPAAQIAPIPSPRPEFDRWIEALARHLAGNQPRLDLPLDIRATAFQMRVWNYLQTIPYGEVQSYAEVAEAIGKPTAARAVAQACAANTIALAIPCHRVIRGTGELGGYRWGLERKRALIDLERSAARG